MHIVTLTSDWNESDYYIGSLKGRILSCTPEANIQDINHNIKPFNIAQAAFVVRNCFRNFPEGTIHIIAVNSEPANEASLLAARIDKHYFLFADNGIPGLIARSEDIEVVRLSIDEKQADAGFTALSVFAGAACALIAGKKLEDLGPVVSEFKVSVRLRPTIEAQTIIGSVVYIDSYENAITNISKELFERVGKGQSFQILVQSKHYIIERISTTYSEVDPGDLVAIFNSAGLLEIAVRNGNASNLLKLNENSSVRIEFQESETSSADPEISSG